MKYIFRIGIPIVFFVFVFSVIQPSDIADVFYKADWVWFVLGCFSVALGNYLSSLRTRVLLFENSQPLLILWHIHALRAMITGALPFSSGELSYVYYLKKYCITPAAEGLAILVSVRFLEFVMFLCLLFLLAVIGMFMDASPMNQAALGIIIINLGIVYFALCKTSFLMKTLTFCMGVLSKVINNKEFSNRIFQKTEHFSQAVKGLFSSDKRPGLLILTFCIVILRNVFVLSMIRAMGVSISVWFIVYLFIFLFVTRFFQGFGSFGNQEVGISGALLLLGYTRTDALSIAIGTHLLQWIPVLFLGVFSYIGIQSSK